MDSLRNPSGRSLAFFTVLPLVIFLFLPIVLVIVVLVVPLLLLAMYAWLRYLTGHRATSATFLSSPSTERTEIMESLRNPSGATLVIVTILAVVPLFWPVTLYVWLRFLTGHRAIARTEAVSPDWGQNK